MVKNFETLPKGTLLEIKTKDWKEIIEFLEYSENWAVPYSFRILVSDGGDLLTVKEFEFEIFYTTKAWLKNSKIIKKKDLILFSNWKLKSQRYWDLLNET
jgi:hypothetical protein